MHKDRKMKPISKAGTYLKYGFVITEHEFQLCPRCGSTLNAGPNYQPKFCDQCGQQIDFEGIEWKEDRVLGYAQAKQEGGAYAPVEN